MHCYCRRVGVLMLEVMVNGEDKIMGCERIVDEEWYG